MDDMSAAQAKAAELLRLYRDDRDFLERRFEVPPLDELLAADGVVGIARWIVLPSFGLERIHTSVYSADSMLFETVRAATSLWVSLHAGLYAAGDRRSQYPIAPFSAADCVRRSATLPLAWDRMPERLSSWDALTTAATAAQQTPDSAWTTLDGVAYRLRLRAPGLVLDAGWVKPFRPEHDAQANLVDDYDLLLKAADLFPEEREATRKHKLLRRAAAAVEKKQKQRRKRS